MLTFNAILGYQRELHILRLLVIFFKGFFFSIRPTDPISGNAFDATRKKKVNFVERDQAPVVLKVDSAIHWINIFPLDSAIGFPNAYPLDSAIHLFKQLGPGC